MTETEKKILEILKALNHEVSSMNGPGAKPNLVRFFNRLDQLTTELPETTHPRLMHYMHKRSYEKALLFLSGETEDIQRGQCDGSISRAAKG